jgi:hypothetical protein
LRPRRHGTRRGIRRIRRLFAGPLTGGTDVVGIVRVVVIPSVGVLVVRVGIGIGGIRDGGCGARGGGWRVLRGELPGLRGSRRRQVDGQVVRLDVLARFGVGGLGFRGGVRPFGLRVRGRRLLRLPAVVPAASPLGGGGGSRVGVTGRVRRLVGLRRLRGPLSRALFPVVDPLRLADGTGAGARHAPGSRIGGRRPVVAVGHGRRLRTLLLLPAQRVLVHPGGTQPLHDALADGLLGQGVLRVPGSRRCRPGTLVRCRRTALALLLLRVLVRGRGLRLVRLHGCRQQPGAEPESPRQHGRTNRPAFPQRLRVPIRVLRREGGEGRRLAAIAVAGSA